MEKGNESASVRVLCPKLVILNKERGLQWLIGSPFFPPFTLLSTFACIHTLPHSPLSPDFTLESQDLRMLIPKGFHIIGALIIGGDGPNFEEIAGDAIDASRSMRKLLTGGVSGEKLEDRDIIGAVAGSSTDGVRFFVSGMGKSAGLEPLNSIVYEDHPEKCLWERGCLLRCRLPIKLPVYYSAEGQLDLNEIYSRAIREVADKFKDPWAAYIVEAVRETSAEAFQPVILHGRELDFDIDLSNFKLPSASSQDSKAKSFSCSHFCSKSAPVSSFSPFESADIIEVSVLHNRTGKSSESAAPVAEYIPALEKAHFLVVEYELEVICYAARGLPLIHAVSMLIIPALIDQLHLMKNATFPTILTQHPQLRPYHFCPPGILHPVTSIYQLSYGETEMKQVEVRRSLHLRLGLPLDRPLLRVANALNFSVSNNSVRSNPVGKGPSLLKDVHVGIPSSGVSGGFASLVQGSYEYHHYLQDGFDDSGWGCAYRSLQTIISWFKLQHYTSIDVPSHREIQQSLVEIGDKDPTFIGSREWIGAIELSFVLDKLLGVSCKVINVRSGAELPEKCRELALHFENQGTPIMIGGGVLAYTLLGVDYNDSSGDCAFLILDPHYTGNDERKKITNAGWCGWKKAVDSKGKNFFLHDKFYNLLLPQRPNMV